MLNPHCFSPLFPSLPQVLYRLSPPRGGKYHLWPLTAVTATLVTHRLQTTVQKLTLFITRTSPTKPAARSPPALVNVYCISRQKVRRSRPSVAFDCCDSTTDNTPSNKNGEKNHAIARTSPTKPVARSPPALLNVYISTKFEASPPTSPVATAKTPVRRSPSIEANAPPPPLVLLALSAVKRT